MIQAANKYQAVPAPRERRGRQPAVQTSGPGPRAESAKGHHDGPRHGRRATIAIPVFQRAPKEVRLKHFDVFIPRLTPININFEEWMETELREGTYLHEYMRRERGLSVKRQRAVARRMHGFKQNMKSEYEIKAAVPAREFFRWKQEDPDFWLDDKNLRSLKRDNPDMAPCIFV